ncbi:hypothetical protein LK994_01575 [Ferruginibacter lapsinanis]|uniref:hypothetical protein n=1 Tax=Ferruginibacter lapsinanis TaxID=563172 RepID=UPI001E3EA21A|nr:hypothetical protein [Ferruginibacter lapsinanis]UEG50163.1 hypothetical protein LK994_01575 [Ferruginibacter lapsinanis]
MIENTKITLSAKELELVCNTDWILTKHNIINKIYLLFGNAAVDMQQTVNKCFLSDEIKQTTPKISKGENYQLLPYVMLDYPRLFNKKNIMAIRTFFWWGDSISIHLLLSGDHKTNTIEKIKSVYTSLQHNDYSICIADTPWLHHFEADNYILIKDMPANTFWDTLQNNSFIKIGKKISLTRLGEADAFINNTFKEMINLLEN